MFGIGYGKLTVEVVGMIKMVFMGISKVFLEWHYGWTESVAGGNLASVSPATAS